MTPDMLRRAVAVIGPPAERRAACEAMVRAAFTMVENNPFARMYHGNTKRAKLQARRLSAVIKRTLVVLNHPDLSEDLRSFFPDSDMHRIFDEKFARALRLPAPDNRLKLKASETIRWLKEALRRAEAAQTKKGQTIRQDATKKKQAILHAGHLLLEFKMEISTASRSSKFCRLAALLYGRPKANLQVQCREFLRDDEDYGHVLRRKRGRK